MIKIGSTGEEVKRIQKKLGITADGIFGPGTEKVVKEWQTKNGLTPDGIIGQKTLDKMFSSEQPIVESVDNTSTLNISKLKGVIPDEVLSQIPDTAKKFYITSNLRLAHFLSQCSHESGNFRSTSENLYYSAPRLREVFPKYFPSTLSEQYAKNPEKIGSRVYADRMGNGGELTGDGYKFRGRGYIQLTGRNNYTNFSTFIGEDCVTNPDLVSTKYPLASAAYFFNSNKLWSICDKGSDDATVKSLTKRVNGGYNGLDDRIEKFKKFYNLLTK
jgi:putative chitinase